MVPPSELLGEQSDTKEYKANLREQVKSIFFLIVKWVI